MLWRVLLLLVLVGAGGTAAYFYLAPGATCTPKASLGQGDAGTVESADPPGGAGCAPQARRQEQLLPAVGGLDRQRQRELARQGLATASFPEALRQIRSVDSGADLNEKLGLIASLDDNAQILAALGRDQSPQGLALAAIFARAAAGGPITLEELQRWFEPKKSRDSYLVYLKLLQQVRHNALSQSLREALAELGDGLAPRSGDSLKPYFDQPLAAAAADDAAADAALPPPAPHKFALLIGINAHRDPALPALATPLADVRALRMLLRRDGYQTTLLENPGKGAIVNGLRALARRSSERDQVIVCYAGHSYLLRQQGYWLPGDADPRNSLSWLSSREIIRLLARVRARQILLLSDGGDFGGLINRSEGPGDARALPAAGGADRRAVAVLTSGGEEPVDGGTGHSVFAEGLLSLLEPPHSEITVGQELYRRLKDYLAERLLQTPDYGHSFIAGHQEGADYRFDPQDSDEHPGDSGATTGADSGAATGGRQLRELIYAASNGSDQDLGRVIRLAEAGNREAQVGAAHVFEQRGRSRANLMRAIAWFHIAHDTDEDHYSSGRERGGAMTDEFRQIRSDAEIFTEGLIARHPELKAGTPAAVP